MVFIRRIAICLLTSVAVAAPMACAADERGVSAAEVKAIAQARLHVDVIGKSAVLPVYVSADWSKPLPQITKALIVFHGKLRNAGDYNLSGAKVIGTAKAGAYTLLITPQFLEQQDIDAYHLAPEMLRWAPDAWMGGLDATAPAAISSFDAVDAILMRLADRKLFPNLKTVVLAGHSGGGQVVQRYAVVGKAPDRLKQAKIDVRFVVANPSSYLYFSADRPLADGSFGPPAKSCYGRYNHWKYGPEAPPAYVGHVSFGQLEERFLTRQVIYLLGTRDVDPNHPVLDKTCAAEDEGAYRYIRGHNYFRYLEQRHPQLAKPNATQQVWDVEGVDHDGDKMFNSPCGLAAIFQLGSCPEKSAK